jgi:hypothetical protein
MTVVLRRNLLTPILLTWRIWRAPNNASRWQMGFNSAFKGLIVESGFCVSQFFQIFYVIMDVIARFCYITEKATLSNMGHCLIPFLNQRYQITDALIKNMLITTTFCAFLFFSTLVSCWFA